MSEPTPYRLHVAQPVCAKCKHRRDAKLMDADQPWRDWFCMAKTNVIWREEYNHITGVTTPAKMGHDRCKDVNIDGTCTMFEPLPPPEEAAGDASTARKRAAASRATQVEEEDSVSWFGRMWRRFKS